MKIVEVSSGIYSYRVYSGTYQECVSKRKELNNEKKKEKIKH